MQTIILAAGKSFTNKIDQDYPVSMIELNGTPLVQWIIEDLKTLTNNKIVIVVNQEEIDRFHIDRTLKLIEPGITVIGVDKSLNGAACSALLALQHLDSNKEVLILNGNEKITENHQLLLERIYNSQSSATVVSFDSMHPRYSFARIDSEGNVVELSEKDPISRNALVGFFWFSKAHLIENAIKNMILKDFSVNNIFYLSPAINEIILQGLKVSLVAIENSKYHPLKSEWQFGEFTKAIGRDKK